MKMDDQRRNASRRQRLMAPLTTIGVGFVLLLGWRYRLELVDQLTHLRLDWALISLAMLLTANISSAGLFAVLANRSTARTVDRRTLAGTFLLSQAAKYVPGRIWGVVQQTASLAETVPARLIVIANIELALLMLVATTGIGAALIVGSSAGTWVAMGALLIVWIAMQMTISTALMTRLFAIVQKLLPGEMPPEHLLLAPGKAGDKFVSGLCSGLFIVMYCLGWLALLHGAMFLNYEQSLGLVAILSLSSALGMISLLPAGLGAREAAVFGLGAALGLDFALVASVAVSTRLAMLAIDLLSVPLGWAMIGATGGIAPREK